MSHHLHLTDTYPQLSGFLTRITPLSALEPQKLPVGEAVAKIVVGQMLSRAAADTIYSRLVEMRLKRQVDGCWQLGEADLLGCGLSRRKARTIQEFGCRYDCSKSEFEAWRDLEYVELSSKVSDHWGLSQWSADMLAIFYFAKEDVFPATDGTIQRVRRILEEDYLGYEIDPNLARPYRSYLARSMWAFLDEGILC